MRHCAFRIDRRDLFECLPRLRISHVMQERDGAIEFRLSFFGTRDRKVDRAQVMSDVLIGLVCISTHAGRKQNDHYADRGPGCVSVFHIRCLK